MAKTNPLQSNRARLLIGAVVVACVVVWLLWPIITAPSLATRHAWATATAQAQVTATAQAIAQREAEAALSVRGNRLVDQAGHVVTLRGVNRDGTDFLCVDGTSVFDGPTGPSSIQALLSWRINVVRIPLNEGCWLGEPGIPAAYSGPAYQDAIAQYVAALHAVGLYVILDLHKVSPDGRPNAHTFQPMPDAAYAPSFWISVAQRFGGDGMTILDLYNEPTGIDWSCWRDGAAACAGQVSYPAVGMQTLVDTVRGAGARNVLLVSGLAWAGDLDGWLAHEPHDPLGELAAGWHVYTLDNTCHADTTCYDQTTGPVSRAVPLIVSEFGNDVYGRTCGLDGEDTLLAWLDAHGASYLAWSWNVGEQTCQSLALIASYNGTPKAPNGTFFHDHLQAVTP